MKQTLISILLAFLCLTAKAQSSDILSTPLTFEALKDGVVTIDNPLGLTLQYSLNGYSKMTVNSSTIEMYISEGDRLALYGNNSAYSSSTGTPTVISSSVECYIYGKDRKSTRLNSDCH